MPSRKSTDLAETRSWAILENGTEGKTVNWHYSLFLKHHHELNAWKTPTEKKKKTCIKKPATTFSSSSVMSKKKEKGILKTLAAVSNPSPESSVYSGSCEQGLAEALLHKFLKSCQLYLSKIALEPVLTGVEVNFIYICIPPGSILQVSAECRCEHSALPQIQVGPKSFLA